MATMTLLQMTQNILSAMDSDNVNSIDDTVESLQVAEIIKETYYELMAGREWPFLRTLTALEGLGDTSNPTKLKMPDNLNKVLWFKYNGKEVTYLDPEVFQDKIDRRSELADVVDANGYGLNQDPTYWTTFDDTFIVCDSRDQDADTTLQGSKTKVYGAIEPAWTVSDSFIPQLPAKFFPTFLAEAKSVCFVNLKQQPNPKEERRAQRGRFRMQNEAWRADAGEVKSNSKINYGRK